ncbi:MAG: 1-acyl-sn-glycerol-3-phosphate acyltransferase, partial [Pseudanabaenaceae cyanobacterium]
MVATLQPPLAHLPPQFAPRLRRFLKPFLPLWLRWACGLTRIEEYHLERLVPVAAEFAAQKARYILAFRHPSTRDDPFLLMHLVSRALPQAAQAQGVNLPQPTHTYFAYDRGIPLWAGRHIAWLFPRLGGISVRRGTLDRAALKTLREILVQGEFPLAIAPEGGTNHHSEAIEPLEPGTAQLGFWALEDLRKLGRSERVYIVPITFQYLYESDNSAQRERYLQYLEKQVGVRSDDPVYQAAHATAVPLSASIAGPDQKQYQRLFALGMYVVNYIEQHYRRFYGHLAPPPLPENAPLSDRLDSLRDFVLRVAESYFATANRGTVMDRCRRLESIIWERMYREDYAEVCRYGVLGKGLGDRLAQDAAAANGHMRLAESVRAITGTYVASHPSPTRFAETLILLGQALDRVQGKPYGQPLPDLGPRYARLTAGEPIDLTPRYEEYQSSRSAAKQCLADVNTAIAQA